MCLSYYSLWLPYVHIKQDSWDRWNEIRNIMFFPKNECAFSHTENIIHNKQQPSASLCSEITAQQKLLGEHQKKYFEIILSPYQCTEGVNIVIIIFLYFLHSIIYLTQVIFCCIRGENIVLDTYPNTFYMRTLESLYWAFSSYMQQQYRKLVGKSLFGEFS